MIDAYVHCGRSKYEPVESVLATMRVAHVDRAVLVQHLDEYDNGYLEDVVAASSGVFSAVALIDPRAADWEDRLAAVAESPGLRGLRLTTDMMAANPRLGIAAASMKLVPVLYTPDGVASARDAIASLATSAPQRPIVVTHLGCPKVRGGQVTEGWDLIELADLPNLLVALSGRAMFCPYPHRPLDHFVREVVDAFTAQRVMWGSNYPVCGDATEYVRDLSLILSNKLGLDPRQIDLITETNAEETFFYAKVPSREI